MSPPPPSRRSCEPPEKTSDNPRETFDPSGPFNFDGERRLLICQRCEQAVTGRETSVRLHLRTDHAELDASTRKAITAYWAAPGKLLAHGLPALTPDDGREISLLQARGYIPGLRVHRGFGCQINGCIRAFSDLKTLLHHQRVDHGQEGFHREDIPFQMLFGKAASGQGRSFQVVPPAALGGVVASESSLSLAKELVRRYDVVVAAQAGTHAVLPTKPEVVELSIWDRRTAWHERFAGQDMVQHHTLTRLPSDGRDPPSWTRYLVKAIEEAVLRCHLDAHRQSLMVRRHFRSADHNRQVVDPSPIREILRPTLDGYTSTWKHFICYLLRAPDASFPTRLDLPSAVQLARQKLLGLLSGEHPPKEGLILAVLHLSYAVLESRARGGDFGHPLYHFIGVFAFLPDSRRFQSAMEISPSLAAIIYLLRIFGMQHALPLAEVDDMDDPHLTAANYVASYLRDGGLTCFTPIYNLFLFARRLGRDSYTRPTVVWKPNHSGLWYKGDYIGVDAFRSWVRGLVQDMRHHLCERLLFKPDEFLRTARHPRLFQDQMTWTPVGDCFREISASAGADKAWQDTFLRVRGRSSRSELFEHLRSELEASTLPGSGRKTPSLQQYLDDVLKFLEKLVLCFFFTLGLPHRGSELAAIKPFNGPYTMRNLYLVDGSVVCVSDYNKTDSLAMSPKVIARFLPGEVGEAYVALIVDVLPLTTLIKATLRPDIPPPPLKFLFSRHGQPFSTDTISRWMSATSEAGLGVRLTISRAREIMIAIDRRFLRSEANRDVDDSVLAHILQAGHSEEIENHHYGLLMTDLHGLSDENLDAFRRCSVKWHRWYNFPSTRTIPDPPPSGPQMPAPVFGETDTQFPGAYHARRIISTQEDVRAAVEGLTTIVQRQQAFLEGLAQSRTGDRREMTSDRHQSGNSHCSPNTSYPLDTPTPRLADRTSKMNTAGEQGPQNEHSGAPPRTASSTIDKHPSAAHVVVPMERFGAVGFASDTTPGGRKRPHSIDAMALTGGRAYAQEEDGDGRKADDILHSLRSAIDGSCVSFRSLGQRKALVAAVVERRRSLIVRLPPAAGKSLLIQAMAHCNPGKVTVVVVPFRALRQSLRTRCAHEAGIQSHLWSPDSPGEASLVFVTPEMAIKPEFRSYLDGLDNRLAGIIIDECHILALDFQWRESMRGLLRLIHATTAQLILMSGTLPLAVLNSLQDALFADGSAQRQWLVVSEPTRRPRLGLYVVDIPDDQVQALVKDLVAGPRREGFLVMVVATTCAGAREAAGWLQVQPYLGEDGEECREKIWQGFLSKDHVAVGTSAFATGTDPANVRRVIHLGGSWGLAALFQHACRGGRSGGDAESIVVLSSTELRQLRRERSRVGEIDYINDAAMPIASRDRAALLDYLLTSGCRREVLSQYLDSGVTEEVHRSCGKDDNPCDRCGGRPSPFPSRPVDLGSSNPCTPTRGLEWAWQYTRGETIATTAALDPSSISTRPSPVFLTPHIHSTGSKQIPSRESPLPSSSSPGFEDISTPLKDHGPRRTSSSAQVAPFKGSPSRVGCGASSVTCKSNRPPASREPRQDTPETIADSIQSSCENGAPGPPRPELHRSEMVRVGHLQFPDICQTSSPRAATAFVATLGRLDVYQATFTALQEVHRVVAGPGCLSCWLHPTANWHGHLWNDCTSRTLQVGETQAFTQGAKADKRIPNGVHYYCFLPTEEPFHALGSQWRHVCRHADLVAYVVCLAYRQVNWQAEHESGIRKFFLLVGIDHGHHDLLSLGRQLVSRVPPRPRITGVTDLFTKIALFSFLQRRLTSPRISA